MITRPSVVVASVSGMIEAVIRGPTTGSARTMATTTTCICASTVKGLVKEARKPGSFKWGAKDDHRQELLQARFGETPNVAEPAA
jgi:hypothetical protein